MSDFNSDMVGREPVGFDDFASSWSPPFDDQTIAESFSRRLEKVSNRQNWEEGIASPKERIRELAELLLPGQPAKLHYPRLARVLGLSERRVRSIYNGEVSRLWDDESSALRGAHADAINAKARRSFAAAAASIANSLSAAGHPLSAAQRSAINQMVAA